MAVLHPSPADIKAFARAPLDWERDGRDWPNRAHSRFVEAGGLVWHVQIMGEGPPLLLLHGTGATTHSWRGLAPVLAADFRVYAPDLPVHGFTGTPFGFRPSLEAMAEATGALTQALGLKPEVAVGHSAGAAIAIRMALDGRLAPRAIISLNGSLLPFGGLRAVAFPIMAKMLFLNPFAAPVLSRVASAPNSVERMLAGTGSAIEPEGLALYERLFRNTDHVAGVTAMMAHWDLSRLKRDLPRLQTPLVLVTASEDAAVPPYVSYEVQGLAPRASVVKLHGLGHLAHEEDPEAAARVIAAAAT